MKPNWHEPSRAANRTQGLLSEHGRRNLVLGVMVLAGLALIVRAVHLQLVVNQPLSERGLAQHIKQERTPVPRGKIVDRFNEPLAVSSPVSALWASPAKLRQELADRPLAAQALAALIDLEPETLRQRLAGRSKAVKLWEGSNPALRETLRQLHFDSVWDDQSYRRFYPDGEIFAHLIGLTDRQDRPLSGLELSHDPRLQGMPGSSRMIKDSRRRPIEALAQTTLPAPGPTLRLSLDRRLQYLLYRGLADAMLEHRAKAAYGVMVDAASGEVLAMVNRPGSDPNDYLQRRSSKLRNRVVADLFEPGSTLKPFAVAAALELGLVTPRSLFDTSPGVIRVGRFNIRDYRSYGVLSVSDIIAKSSNVGMTQIAQRLQPEQLWSLYDRLGFGRKTALGLTGERRGRLRQPSRWGVTALATHSYGYGLSVTALQLAQAYTVLASYGVSRPLSLERVSRPPPGERLLSERTCAAVLKMLERAVAADGTGALAAVNGYRVAGKTGTVHKPKPSGGYYPKRYQSLFAGIVPASRPRLVLVVVVDEPGGKAHFGGLVAAPVFGEVMRQALPLLGIPPDPEMLAPEKLVQLSQN